MTYHQKPVAFSRRGLKAVVVCAIVGAAIWALGLWALYRALTLPIVYESYSTGYCVRVDDVRGVYSCENMPRKYHHVWTE